METVGDETGAPTGDDRPGNWRQASAVFQTVEFGSALAHFAGCPAGGYALILYPFIDGTPGMEIGLSDRQWIELGAVLKNIHTIRLPPALLEQLKKEAFAPKWSGVVKALRQKIKGRSYDNRYEKTLAAFWRERWDEISKLVDRAKELGRLLQHQPPRFVLCHADIHTANVLLGDGGKLFIVDWDETLLAPKERDLMFVVGAREEDSFFRGYGKTDIDWVAFAYYRYEWVVQEIGEFGELVFSKNDVGEKTKRAALQGFSDLFQRGDVVEAAYKSEQALPPRFRAIGA